MDIGGTMRPERERYIHTQKTALIVFMDFGKITPIPVTKFMTLIWGAEDSRIAAYKNGF
jgi:hypothetical protein